MATKDFNSSEDEKHPDKNLQESKGVDKPVEKNTSSSEIKNAHATGDGSFGRSESSLPDKEISSNKDNTY